VKSLDGCSAVVTGASRGIGARIATALGEEGVRVVLIARTEKRLAEQAANIPGSIAVIADVTDPESVERATSRISSELNGAPDIVVNNAGIFSIASVEETTVEQFSQLLNTNLVAPFLFVRAFLADMKKHGRGHIITIGSVADRTIFGGNAAYSAAKFGLRAVHEVLRTELRGTGVRASLISPASTDTDIWNDVTLSDPGEKPPAKRPMLQPDDVARAVIYALTQPDSVNVDELRLSHS
jgi:NADP-dependent 3-hydroxy acid dehydrogenase YdfG